MAAEFNLSSAEPDSATFSKPFSVAAAAARLSADFGGRQATAERGADVEADIMVTLEEALNGSTRTVSLRRAGSNKVENYQVKIPRGVREGQRIRLAGQGEAGVGGGKSGDLFLRVRLARHPDFSVEGSDLIHEVKIEPWRAVLGSENCCVPTLEGKGASENSTRHTGWPAISAAGTGLTGCLRKAWRPLRRSSYQRAEEIDRPRTGNLERLGKTAWHIIVGELHSGRVPLSLRMLK